MKQFTCATHHFASGFIGESHHEDVFRPDALFKQISYSVGKSPSFTRTCPGDDEGGSGGGGDGGVLLGVQLAGVVDLQVHRGVKWLQDVVA